MPLSASSSGMALFPRHVSKRPRFESTTVFTPIKETSAWMPLLFGGGRWIRTTEGIASRFTVCPIWPLWNSPIFNCVGAGGRIRTPDLLITNVSRSINALISGTFRSFRVGGSAVYKPAASIQYMRSCSRLGHGLGQTRPIYKIDFSKKSTSV